IVLAARDRQLEREGRPTARSVTRGTQVAAELASRLGARVQAEAVPSLLGGEPVPEDLLEVLGGDPDPAVGYRDLDERRRRAHAHDQLLGRAGISEHGALLLQRMASIR